MENINPLGESCPFDDFSEPDADLGRLRAASARPELDPFELRAGWPYSKRFGHELIHFALHSPRFLFEMAETLLKRESFFHVGAVLYALARWGDAQGMGVDPFPGWGARSRDALSRSEDALILHQRGITRMDPTQAELLISDINAQRAFMARRPCADDSCGEEDTRSERLPAAATHASPLDPADMEQAVAWEGFSTLALHYASVEDADGGNAAMIPKLASRWGRDLLKLHDHETAHPLRLALRLAHERAMLGRMAGHSAPSMRPKTRL